LCRLEELSSSDKISAHFRATGITAYLKNGGRLEWPTDGQPRIRRTTGLYDAADEISLDEVERIGSEKYCRAQFELFACKNPRFE